MIEQDVRRKTAHESIFASLSSLWFAREKRFDIIGESEGIMHS
jgi:hypothetical protein